MGTIGAAFFAVILIGDRNIIHSPFNNSRETGTSPYPALIKTPEVSATPTAQLQSTSYFHTHSDC